MFHKTANKMNIAELYRYCPGQGLSLVLTSKTSTKLKSTFSSGKGQLDHWEPTWIPKSGRKTSFARLVPPTREEPPAISSTIAVRSSAFCAKEIYLERGDPFRQADPCWESVTWTLLDTGGEVMQTGGTGCCWPLPIWYSYRISQRIPRGLSEIAVLVTACSVCKKCLALKNLKSLNTWLKKKGKRR